MDISLRESVDVDLFDQGHGGLRDTGARLLRRAVPHSGSVFYHFLLGASWNNNIGSLRFALYPWNSSYDTTRSGDPIDTKEFINFPDNSVLRMEADGTYPAGEYLLYIINTSDSASEEVGFGSLGHLCPCPQLCRRHGGCVLRPHHADLRRRNRQPAPAAPARHSRMPRRLSPPPEISTRQGGHRNYAMGNTDTYGVQFRAASAFTGCEVYVSGRPRRRRKSDAVPACVGRQLCQEHRRKAVRRCDRHRDPTRQLGDASRRFQSRGVPAGAVRRIRQPRGRDARSAHRPFRDLPAHVCLRAFAGQPADRHRHSTEKPSTPNAQDFVSSGAWAATDGLGRTLPDSKTAGGIREGKYVGLFYHTWHASLAKTQGDIVNVSEIVAKYPEAVRDYDHPAWGGVTTCFWNEPLFGYYNNGIDRWVLRKHAELRQTPGWMSCSSTTPTEQKTSSAPSRRCAKSGRRHAPTA